MANFKEVFPRGRAVIPVVHVQDQRQALNNAGIAYDQGADGVFLISMTGISHQKLQDIQQIVRVDFPDFWIGVNYLDLSAKKVFKNVDRGISGVWSDNAMINENSDRQTDAEIIRAAKIESKWSGIYFGGVAFKYQKPVTDCAAVAAAAVNFMDVVTTSGEGTGISANIDKIRIMKEAMGNHPLAIASGISPENVHNFTPYADAFLVASSLLVKGTENFDKFKVRDLVEASRK